MRYAKSRAAACRCFFSPSWKNRMGLNSPPSGRGLNWNSIVWAISLLVVPVPEKKLPSPSDVRKVRQISVQKSSEVGVCPKIDPILTIGKYHSYIIHDKHYIGCFKCCVLAWQVFLSKDNQHYIYQFF